MQQLRQDGDLVLLDGEPSEDQIYNTLSRRLKGGSVRSRDFFDSFREISSTLLPDLRGSYRVVWCEGQKKNCHPRPLLDLSAPASPSQCIMGGKALNRPG